MHYYSGKGDQGNSNLADGRPLSKGDLVFELIGTLDEATAQIGMAISLCEDGDLKSVFCSIQGQLSGLMGFLAGAKVKGEEMGPFLSEALCWLEGKINAYGGSIGDHKGFLFAGRSLAGASIDIARTVVRRAERQAVRYFERVEDDKREVLAYLNRLSSLLFVLRIFIDNYSNTQKST